jgi:Xaa-Pro aminopeptidase
VSDRIRRLQATLEEPLLVTNPVNVRYLCGFHSSNPALLVEPERARLFSDFRYAEAGREVEGVEFEEVDRAVLKDLGGRLSGRIGFEADFVTYSGWQTLADSGLELVPRSGLVERLRAVKDERELAAIRRAGEITSEGYARLAQEPFLGRTELEIAGRLEQLFRELGADASAFPPIVAAGPNGARPHADPSDRRLEPGQLVVIDAGCAVDGYCSDCTRTFSTGSLPDELQEAYDVCRAGQQAGVEAVRAGASGRDVDGVARKVIDDGGLGEHFDHGLGHGVGLAVHEAPRLTKTSEDVLEAGNVVTVEPGIYLSGRGGVRIEDLVVVTDGAAEVLTSFTKELVTVG